MKQDLNDILMELLTFGAVNLSNYSRTCWHCIVKTAPVNGVEVTVNGSDQHSPLVAAMDALDKCRGMALSTKIIYENVLEHQR